MGLFSFIKDAGAKVFGIGKTAAEENAVASLEESARASCNFSYCWERGYLR